VSVPQRFQLDVLIATLVGLLPDAPPLFPMSEITDEPEETLVGELIREAALEGVEDELPHSIMVVVEEMGLRGVRQADQQLLGIYASMIVERDPRRALIGHRGSACARSAPQRCTRSRLPQDPGLSRSAGEGAQGVATRPQNT
jgi:GTP-binding protein Era